MAKAVPFEKYLKVEVKKAMTAAAVIARKHLKKTKPFKYARKDQVSSPGQVPRSHSKYLNNAIYVSVQGNRWFIGLNKLRNEDIPLNLEKGGVPIPENKDLLDEKVLKPRPYLDYLYGKSDILKYFQENLDKTQKAKKAKKERERNRTAKARKKTINQIKKKINKQLKFSDKLLKKTNKKVTKFVRKNIKLFKKKIKKITKKNARRR